MHDLYISYIKIYLKSVKFQTSVANAVVSIDTSMKIIPAKLRI